MLGEIDLNNLYETLPPAEFSSLFCQKMRMRKKLENAVSSRQAIAISKLLIAAAFRKGTTDLTSEDYMRSAIISTAPEDQEVAREVALNILFPKVKLEDFTFDEKHGKGSGKQMLLEIVADTEITDEDQTAFSKEILDGLGNFLDEMSSEFNLLDEKSAEERMETVDELDFYFDAINKYRNEQQPFFSLINSLNDPTDILFQKIKNLNELKDTVDQILMSNLNNIPISQLPAIPHSNVRQKIAQETKNEIEKAIAQHALGKKEAFDASIKKMLKNPINMAKVAKALHDSGQLSQKDFEDLASQAASSTTTSSEIYNVTKNTQLVTETIKEKLFDIMRKEQSLAKALEMITSLENDLKQPLTMDFVDKVLENPKLEEKLSHQTLPFIPMYNKRVEQAVNKSINKEIEDFKKLNQPKNFEDMYKDIQQISQDVKNPYYQKMLQQNLNKIGNDWMKSIPGKNHFLNVGRQLVRQGIKLVEEQIMKYGQQIGCHIEEINEMLYTNFEALINSIKKENKDFHGYSSMMKSIPLNEQQMNIVANTAFGHQNKAAVAALASQNLALASKAADANNAVDMLLSSLSAGSGENLLEQWFISRDKIPSEMRNKMKKILSKIVIQTAMDMARMKLGSAESGIMASNQTRPFREGDEFDQLDIENTMDNLISVGKTLEQIVPDDFIMQDLKKGRIALIVLLDISGSMTGVRRLTQCAFLVTMLLARLKEQEVAVALFESNTHALLELLEEQPEIDKVIDELLEIKARGGTVVNRALTWAYEQFKKVEAEKIYFVVASDFELFYDVKKHPDFQGLVKMKPKTYLIAPGNTINNRELKQWEKAFGGHPIQIKNEKEIIDTVCKIISNR